jgi:hypothetical protein
MKLGDQRYESVEPAIQNWAIVENEQRVREIKQGDPQCKTFVLPATLPRPPSLAAPFSDRGRTAGEAGCGGGSAGAGGRRAAAGLERHVCRGAVAGACVTEPKSPVSPRSCCSPADVNS